MSSTCKNCPSCRSAPLEPKKGVAPFRKVFVCPMSVCKVPDWLPGGQCADCCWLKWIPGVVEERQRQRRVRRSSRAEQQQEGVQAKPGSGNSLLLLLLFVFQSWIIYQIIRSEKRFSLRAEHWHAKVFFQSSDTSQESVFPEQKSNTSEELMGNIRMSSTIEWWKENRELYRMRWWMIYVYKSLENQQQQAH